MDEKLWAHLSIYKAFFFFLNHALWHAESQFPSRIEPMFPALGAWNLNHQTTREVPPNPFESNKHLNK